MSTQGKRLVRRPTGLFPAKTMTRQEFLTPFDRIFDDMFGNMFPTLATDFGDDFFTKGSYPKVNVVNYDECIEIDAAIPGMTKDDLYAIGSMGLIDAAKKFDDSKGVLFKTYSITRIRGNLEGSRRRPLSKNFSSLGFATWFGWDVSVAHSFRLLPERAKPKGK